jgi:hypothetical protein
MASLRGFTLNSHSYESDENVVPHETVAHTFHCPAGHQTVLRFAWDAEEIPASWDCPKCGRVAHADRDEAAAAASTVDGMALSSPRTTVGGKTHWDMLLERRTTAELESLLEERLALLRARGVEQAG